ncbi:MULTISPECIES: AraC family transcriptional regulator [Tatumella]|uniref:AraC family transcriptional regulator n=1 Tax=Tatumella punctata TaxID=399969 RepID=A0ABW1VP23_9GAMM|nr:MULTISPECIES: AraC family transcriptional regulator [unclassified Tatumella]MBS0856811.1 AraC family transcriptional regulator [Tatumella sp. JGM16]MBS0875724.1 AraC family transcriptional regulator [Tatumella sp. JGM82]MBS0890129.1 AraC family transcriptional regulator [Tatumella sp. JGM94]MBS0893709.1 AraC family transcriptional regulator [Tatumella sp. JGM130]MBS0900255.1 AraC family transcriptional regulator [Tatumella sp. JGM100]
MEQPVALLQQSSQAVCGLISGNRGVLAAAATGLSDFICGQGGDADRIFGLSGVDPELLGSPTLSLGLVNYCRVLEEAARHSASDNFGLHYGRQFKPQALGLIGYIGLCSPTLDIALHNVVQAFPSHQHDTLVRRVDKGDHWRLDYQVRHGAILCRRQDAELTMGMFMNLIRHSAGQHWAPREVHFEHSRPENWHEHCKIFDAPVYFDQPYNSLLIAKRDLQRSMPDNDPMLLMVMQDALQRLNLTRESQGLTGKVRAAIHLLLSNGEPALETVAENLGLSAWTLQRRLREHNVSFSVLVDNVRSELATHYLQQKSLSVSAMAMLLGYSEVSAFSRACRRWFGISPRQWRRQENLTAESQ